MKKLNLDKPTRLGGFTIIEVMIVLAVAGLIMIIVLVAAPQLQRNSRNSSRKSIVNRIKTEVDNYSSNNLGALPTADSNASTGFNSTTGGFYTRYIKTLATNNEINDPSSGSPVTLSTWTGDNNVSATGTLYYVTGRVCNGETSQAGNTRNYIIMSPLEGGAIYCVDNQ